MMNVMLNHISSQNSHVGWLICEGLVEYQYHHHHHNDNNNNSSKKIKVKA